MRKRLTASVVVAILLGSVPAFAQGDTDCLTILSHAESEFSAGRFYGIPGMLQDCLKSNRFSNEEKVRVNMLLTQVYLLTDRAAAADSSYLNLLRANPEFVPSDLDPIDVVYLSKKFTSTPIFTPHIKIGGNVTSQSLIYSQNVITTPELTRVRHRPLVGWTVGGGVEWNYSDNLGIGIEGLLSQKKFRTDTDDLFNDDYGVAEERQLWLDIPVYVRYGWHKGTIRPFAYAGGSINLLLSAKVDESYNDRTLTGVDDNGDETYAVVPTAAPARTITYKRNLFNRALVIGGGAKIKIGKDFILVDVRYMPGLTSVVNEKYNNYSSKDRTSIDPSMTQFASIGDIFRINNMSVSFGYVRPLYNPRRAAHVKTKSVLRSLNRRDKDEK